MLLISETDYNIMQALMMAGFIWMGLSLILVRNHLIARIREVFLGKGKTVLRADLDGVARWGNQKASMGYFQDKDNHTQIAADRAIRTNDGIIYVMSEGFGLSYDLDIAQSTDYLERLGFTNLKEALQAFDTKYFNIEENQKKLKTAKESDNFVGTDDLALDSVRYIKPGEEIKNKAIYAVLKEARKKLIIQDLDLMNNWTYRLAVGYRWGLQNQGSMNNKNIYDKGILNERKNAVQQGWSQEKTQGMAITALMIIVGGAIAAFILNASGIAGGGSSPPPTTIHTLATTTTTIIQNISIQNVPLR